MAGTDLVNARIVPDPVNARIVPDPVNASLYETQATDDSNTT